MFKAFLGEHWIVIVLVIGAFIAVYNLGSESKDKDWQIRWEARNVEASDARLAFEAKQREIERGLRDEVAKQIEINDLQRIEGERIKLESDAALIGMHSELGALRLRLQRAGNTSGDTSTVSSVTRAAMVLSDLYAGCSVERQELAGSLDESRRRAVKVEQMYDKARGQ